MKTVDRRVELSNDENMEKLRYSTKEAAALLGICTRQLHKLVNERRITAVGESGRGRRRFFTPEELRAYASQPVDIVAALAKSWTPMQASAPPLISTEAEYEALPMGAAFTAKLDFHKGSEIGELVHYVREVRHRLDGHSAPAMSPQDAAELCGLLARTSEILEQNEGSGNTPFFNELVQDLSQTKAKACTTPSTPSSTQTTSTGGTSAGSSGRLSWLAPAAAASGATD